MAKKKLKRIPLCPSCVSDNTELLPGRVVYSCMECDRAFQAEDVERWREPIAFNRVPLSKEK